MQSTLKLHSFYYQYKHLTLNETKIPLKLTDNFREGCYNLYYFNVEPCPIPLDLSYTCTVAENNDSKLYMYETESILPPYISCF
jgi:hypothetical protein